MRSRTAALPNRAVWGTVAVLAASLALLALTTVPLGAQNPVLWHGYAQYRYTRSSSTTGFSLQRSQPDFLVPLIERAGVVDALIPGAFCTPGPERLRNYRS